MPLKRWTENTDILIGKTESCVWDVNSLDYKPRDEGNKALTEIKDGIGTPNEIKTN